jgi:hypothetical protein
MNETRFVLRPVRHATAAALTTLLLGCTSTPQHTNVLVFGTNTKVALDLSQDATSGIGITLGYKRMEAVWMPLLPNQGSANGSGLQPSPCTKKDDCPKFIGSDSAGQHDTYSVLASFGSKLGAGADATAKDARVKGEIAQYFATGLAARLLAQKGGAGLVNTNGDNLTEDQRAAVADASKKAVSELEQLIAKVSTKDGKALDPTILKSAFAKKPGLNVTANAQKDVLMATSPDDLRSRLSDYNHENVIRPMLVTLSN